MMNRFKKFLGIEDEEVESKDLVTRGMNQINDLIAPDSITEERSLYALGDNLIRTLMVTAFPNTAYMGWLDNLYSYDANIDISIHVTPWPDDQVIKNLNRRISEYASTMALDAEKGSVTDIAIETAYQDANRLREKLHTGQSRLFYQAIYITISAPYLEELDQLTQEIETLCGSSQITTRVVTYRQSDAFLTALPIGADYIKKTRNFDTESLSTCFPLVNAELTDMKGTPVFYGINQINNSPVMFDRFALNNYNSVTLATSGAGKSYSVKLEASRYFMLGTKIIIIDPQGEYEDLCKSFDGQYINLSTSSPDKINPLDIYEGMESHESGYSFLASKIMDILSLVEVMAGSEELTTREKAVVLDVAQKIYKDYGITEDGFEKKEMDDHLINKDFVSLSDHERTMPTLGDLSTVLKAAGDEGNKVAELIESYVTGIMNLFNGETNVNLDNDFIVFGTKDLEEGVEEVAMFVALEYVWGRIKAGDKERRMLIVDEAWKLLDNETSREFLVRVAKTARKFNAGISVITQNVSDFVENGGNSIISNTSLQILLKQTQKEVDELSKLLNLSESEKHRLKMMQVGEALIYAGSSKSLVSIISNSYEHRLCKTSDD